MILNICISVIYDMIRYSRYLLKWKLQNAWNINIRQRCWWLLMVIFTIGHETLAYRTPFTILEEWWFGVGDNNLRFCAQRFIHLSLPYLHTHLLEFEAGALNRNYTHYRTSITWAGEYGNRWPNSPRTRLFPRWDRYRREFYSHLHFRYWFFLF